VKLEPDQEALLRGQSGKALARAIETLVIYGEAFGARRLVPIKSGHPAGTFGAPTFKAYFAVLAHMVSDGVRCQVPTTVNPRPGRELSLLTRLVLGKQRWLESTLEALGATPNYSCVCYEEANVPSRGEVVGWAESSAVQFANSVLGARSNRNSILIDVCSAVTGFTPEFGYLLDENRRGQVLVKLEIEKMDAAALGFVIGRRVVDKVPVILHHDFTWNELKNMGGAMAAAGAVALFHVEGLTPEAPDLETVFDGRPQRTITVTQGDLDEMRAADPERSDIVVFGCPQLTLDEALHLAGRFSGAKVRKPTFFCLVPKARRRFETTEACQRLRQAGVRVTDCCPVAAFSVRLGAKRVLTPSAKCFYYLAGSVYGNEDDCLRACGAES
jgi:predicted aconitase